MKQNSKYEDAIDSAMGNALDQAGGDHEKARCWYYSNLCVVADDNGFDRDEFFSYFSKMTGYDMALLEAVSP